MRILIVGPGAIGCLLISKFYRFSDNIYLLDKHRERASVIRKEGIIVENLKGERENFPVNIFSRVNKIPEVDLIIIATKSYDTQAAAENIKKIINRNTTILTLQNGLNNVKTIYRVLSRDAKIFAGVTSCGAINISCGKIKCTGEGETIIASVQKKDMHFAQKIADFFNQCQIKTKIGEDAQSIIWSKLLINIGINAPASILQIRNGMLLKIPYARYIMEEAILEAEKIAKKKGIKLMYPSAQDKAKEVCRKTSANINSMLQDILCGKKTEIDYLQGAIIKEGKKYRIKTPVNEVLYYLIKMMKNEKYKTHKLH